MGKEFDLCNQQYFEELIVNINWPHHLHFKSFDTSHNNFDGKGCTLVPSLLWVYTCSKTDFLQVILSSKLYMCQLLAMLVLMIFHHYCNETVHLVFD